MTTTDYDAKGRAFRIHDPWGGTTTLSHDRSGNLLRTLLPSGASENRTYDARSRLTGIAETEPDGSIVDQLDYGYRTVVGGVFDGGSNDQVSSETSLLQGTRTYGYDAIGRLISESDGTTTTGYSYDANGDRLTRTVDSTTDYYGYANHRLIWTNQGGNQAPTPNQTAPYRIFGYDGSGRLTSRESRRSSSDPVRTLGYVWDAADDLTAIWDESGPTQVFGASYDGDGLRQAKTDAWTGSHDYVWGGGGVVYDTNQATSYVPGLAQRKNGAVKYYHTDQLGSVRRLSNASGSFADGLSYDAYGNELAPLASPFAGDWHPSDYLYAGAWGYQSEYRSATES